MIVYHGMTAMLHEDADAALPRRLQSRRGAAAGSPFLQHARRLPILVPHTFLATPTAQRRCLQQNGSGEATLVSCHPWSPSFCWSASHPTMHGDEGAAHNVHPSTLTRSSPPFPRKKGWEASKRTSPPWQADQSCHARLATLCVHSSSSSSDADSRGRGKLAPQPTVIRVPDLPRPRALLHVNINGAVKVEVACNASGVCWKMGGLVGQVGGWMGGWVGC